MVRPPSGRRRRPRRAVRPQPDSHTTSRAHAGSQKRDRRPVPAGHWQAVRRGARAGRRRDRRRPPTNRRAGTRMRPRERVRRVGVPLRTRNRAPTQCPASGARAFHSLPRRAAWHQAGPSCGFRPDLDHDEPAAPKASLAECRLDPCQLRASLEQRSPWTRPSSYAVSLHRANARSKGRRRKVRGVATVRTTKQVFQDQTSPFQGPTQELITFRRQ